MKSTILFSIFAIFLFVIHSVSAQELTIEQVGQVYQTKITELTPLDPTNEPIQPYFTSFLIYNTGHYEKANITGPDHVYNNVNFGSELPDGKAEAYAVSTSRYTDDLPPEPNRIASGAITITSSGLDPTFDTKLGYPHVTDCIAIDTNHGILFNHKNILALSTDPANGNHIYLFYNKRINEDGEDGQFVKNFTSFTKSVLQPHYVNVANINEFSSEEFDDNNLSKFINGNFNNVIQYRFDPELASPPEWRFFVGLDNLGVFQSENYEFLVIQTTDKSIKKSDICRDDTVNPDKFDELVGGEFNINDESISAYKYLTLTVEPPTDPNRIWPTSFCSCGSTNEGTQNSLKRYFYSFQFCNESTASSEIPTAQAHSAQITFHDLNSSFDCIKPMPVTKSRLASEAPLVWTLKNISLADLGASGDYSKCCDTIYFYTSKASTFSLKKFPSIAACVVFNGNDGPDDPPPVCDTFDCSSINVVRSLPSPCSLDSFSNNKCNVLFSSDCAGNRYRCFWQPSVSDGGLVIASLGIIGFIGFIGLIGYRRRNRR